MNLNEVIEAEVARRVATALNAKPVDLFAMRGEVTDCELHNGGTRVTMLYRDGRVATIETDGRLQVSVDFPVPPRSMR